MATKKAASNIPSVRLDLYKKLIATHPSVELKGATMPYTSCNGHMFSFLDKEGRLGLRLPERDRTEFLKKYKTTLFEAHGTVMKEYVLVPETLLKKSDTIKVYFRISFDYVSSLKPKPSKK